MHKVKRIALVATAASGLVFAGAGMASASAGAGGVAEHSPGVVSGNVVQVPVNVPVNVCGNTVTVIGLLNPAFGGVCVNK